MHRKNRYRVAPPYVPCTTYILASCITILLLQPTESLHIETNTAKTKSHTPEHRKSVTPSAKTSLASGKSSGTHHAKRSDVKRPLSKIDGNVYTVANIEQLNTVHSVLVNPAFMAPRREGRGTARMTPIQTKSVINQNEDAAMKKEKLLAHITNDENEDFEDSGKTFYGR